MNKIIISLIDFSCKFRRQFIRNCYFDAIRSYNQRVTAEILVLIEFHPNGRAGRNIKEKAASCVQYARSVLFSERVLDFLINLSELLSHQLSVANFPVKAISFYLLLDEFNKRII